MKEPVKLNNVEQLDPAAQAAAVRAFYETARHMVKWDSIETITFFAFATIAFCTCALGCG